MECDYIFRIIFLIVLTVTELMCVDLELQRHSQSREKRHQYCIVGAGPSGLQLGHFFLHSGRDYVIFERAARAGNFFEKYPRHRRLISLNKRVVREGRSQEFAFRHDWNSLLDVRHEDNRTRPVTTRSTALFPNASVLTEYLSDFADEQKHCIHYGEQVRRIKRSIHGSGFEVSTSKYQSGQLVELWSCHEVIVATGFWRPRGAKVKVDGIDHIEGYESLPETGEQYKGKSVAVLGMGNAALETAQELQQHTAEVAVLARSRELPDGDEGIRFAHQTHYVGDIRAGRTTILDTYLLKSLDSFHPDALNGLSRIVIIPCFQKRLCLWRVFEEDCADARCHAKFKNGGQNLNYWLQVGDFLNGSPEAQKLQQLLSSFPVSQVYELNTSISALIQNPKPTRPWGELDDKKNKRRIQEDFEKLGIRASDFDDNIMRIFVTSDLLRNNQTIADLILHMRMQHDQSAGSIFRLPVDHVIRCFGWVMDPSIFDPGLSLKTTHKNKYPKISRNYEAVGVSGLYFAGTLTHGLDFRKSSGGFIHGFRYTARALFRLLEEKNFGVPWPHVTVPLDVNVETVSKTLVEMLRDRINEASGPYQMFEALGDMVVFMNGSQPIAQYLWEVPLPQFHVRYRHLPRVTWVFRYGVDFHGDKVLGPDRVGTNYAFDAHRSNFLHPCVQFFAAGASSESAQHFLPEDVHTQWTSHHVLTPLSRFMSRVVALATNESLTSAA